MAKGLFSGGLLRCRSRAARIAVSDFLLKKENLRKDDEIRATQMGAETEVPRVRDFTVRHHCGRTRGLVDRRGGSCEGACWEASQRCPQEDAEGMLIRHTEHCTYF